MKEMSIRYQGDGQSTDAREKEIEKRERQKTERECVGSGGLPHRKQTAHMLLP